MLFFLVCCIGADAVAYQNLHQYIQGQVSVEPFPALLAAQLLGEAASLGSGCGDSNCIEVRRDEFEWRFASESHGRSHYENLCHTFTLLAGDRSSPFYQELDSICRDKQYERLGDLAAKFMPKSKQVTRRLWQQISGNRHNPFLFDLRYQEILSKAETIGGVHENDELIGKGGHGEVFKRKKDGKLMAVKRITLNGETIPDVLREIHGLEIVKGDDRFVQLYRVQLADWNTVELVMEYLDGVDGTRLFRSLNRRKLPIIEPPEIMAAITKQLLEALHSLHLKHHFHSDMKPGNLFFTKDGRLKIIDMGLVYDYEHPDRFKLGWTPNYMAPEAKDGQQRGPKYDFWSLGVILLENLSRKVPADYVNFAQFEDGVLVNFKQMSDAVQYLLHKASKNLNGVPQYIPFVEKCLRVDVDQRADYQSLIEDPFVNDFKVPYEDLKRWIQEKVQAIST